MSLTRVYAKAICGIVHRARATFPIVRFASFRPSILDEMAAKEEPKSFARRDKLRDIEKSVQAAWQDHKEFECDAPADYVPGSHANAQKFMCTFPYPYMNGKLHLGHAFTVSKAEFAAGYQRLLGKRVLFPFGFHCTGMPIQAAANKLKRDIQNMSHKHDEVEEITEATHALEVTSGAGETKETDVSVFHGKKSKAVAKAGSGATQYDIMLKNGITEADIPKFQDPRYWLEYFPPLGKAHLADMGCHIDWRRSFITTDVNPYYDSFIRWQFNTLKKLGKLGFGKRPTIFSPTDGQACADHDRASGEGVNPMEYTLIKLRLAEIPGDHHAAEALKPLANLIAAGKKIYFVAATLRPETMYGQTNCFLLPEGEYGAFEINDTDVFICAERAARNMSYQNLSKVHGVHVGLGTFTGDNLMGLPIEAPYTPYGKVYTLPLLTISMAKGTGVVTSVPSDAPDDYAALRDLKEKPKLREKYHIKDDMVAFDVIEIIEIPGFGRQAAVQLVHDMKIKSQNDSKALKEAKDQVYMQGFHHGVMLVGKYAGKRVCEAKPLVRTDMIGEGHAALYWEPESEVISRSGDVCVVAELDQWYLKYGEDDWRGAVEAWIKSPSFKAYSAATLASFEGVVAWLKEWACSRSFGLGTKLPWDDQFVIESLSDSTIYMAYYTVAHFLQGGEIDPAKNHLPGPFGIKPEQMTEAVWDYIFIDGPFPEGTAIPKEQLDAMRREFDFWYPMDLRVSGKDLINNHLTMALYNHAAMWTARPDRMPQSFFCNGHVLVDGEKMAKQKGNFVTLEDAIARWGADAVRFALADSGDGLDDANFERAKADIAILKLTTEEEYVRETLAQITAGSLRTGDKEFADLVFESRLNKSVAAAKQAYEHMRFRDALQWGFYQLQQDRDNYRDYCAKMDKPVHADSIMKFFHAQYVVLSPICPHICEYVWQQLLGHADSSVTRAAWPEAGEVDERILATDEYMKGQLHVFRTQMQRVLTVKIGKGKQLPKVTSATIYVASKYNSWQQRVLSVLQPLFAPGSTETGFPTDALSKVQASFLAEPALKPLLKKAMEFGAGIIQAHKGSAAPLSQLSGVPAIDERSVWVSNMDYVRRALDVEEVTVASVEEEGAIESDPSKRAKDVLVGDPIITPITSVLGPVYE